MKGRANRRWREEVIVKKRLKSLSYRSSCYNFHDGNDDRISSPTWKDFIGRIESFMFKTYVTHRWDSRHKVKYSGNRTKGYYRDPGKKGTRIYDKQNLLNILEEYGLRSVNSGQFGKMDYSEWLSICEQICEDPNFFYQGEWESGNISGQQDQKGSDQIDESSHSK